MRLRFPYNSTLITIWRFLFLLIGWHARGIHHVIKIRTLNRLYGLILFDRWLCLSQSINKHGVSTLNRRRWRYIDLIFINDRGYVHRINLDDSMSSQGLIGLSFILVHHNFDIVDGLVNPVPSFGFFKLFCLYSS